MIYYIYVCVWVCVCNNQLLGLNKELDKSVKNIIPEPSGHGKKVVNCRNIIDYSCSLYPSW